MSYTTAEEELSKKFNEQNKLINEIQQQNSKRAKILLLINYEKLLKKLCNEVLNHYEYSPLLFEDYMQYAMHKFFERTTTYDWSFGMNFANYIKKFVKLDLINYAKKYANNHHKILNFAQEINEDQTFFETKLEFTIDDIDFSSLKPTQLELIESLLKNEGDVKLVSKELNIPIKTIYRKRQKIIKKLNIQNKIT